MTPPVFRHGELRLMLLTLISRRPQHGYELIQALSDHFNGAYSPSAGTIYPRLAKLETEGLVTKTTDGRKTVYAITPEGQREVDERAAEFAQVTAESADAISKRADNARDGLLQARGDLRAELDRVAEQLRAEAVEQVPHNVYTPAADSSDTPSQQTEDTIPGETAGDQTEDAAPNTDAPEAAAPTANEPENVGLLRRIDESLQRFRVNVRHDARLASRSTKLDPEVVAEFERDLTERARSFAVQLGIHR